ncbi:7TM diverse intracellular signaling domain-containing protein, partial [Bacteroidota bacterium]
MKNLLFILLLLLSSPCFTQNEIIISDGDIGIKFKLKNDTVVVKGFYKDSPAKIAGVKKGDRIIKIDDCEVSGAGMPLSFIVEKRRGVANSYVKLYIIRDKKQEIQINVQRDVKYRRVHYFTDKMEYIADTNNLWTIDDVSSESFAHNFIPRSVKELSIGKIKEGSISDSIGLLELDQITKINNKIVYNANSIKTLLENYNEQTLNLTIKRDSTHLHFTVPYNSEISLLKWLGINSLAEFIPSSKVYWIRLKIKSDLLCDRPHLLGSDVVWDKMELYIPNTDGSFTKKITGSIYTFDERDISIQSFLLFNLNLAKKETKTLYLKLEDREKLDLNPNSIAIPSQRFMLRKYVVDQFIHAIFFGIILIMVLYNLVLFFFIRDNSYVFYVLYIFSVGLMFFVSAGYGFELLWPNNPQFSEFIGIIASSGIFGFFVLFAKSYLKTKLYLPKWNKAIIVLLYIILITFILSLILKILSIESTVFLNYIVGFIFLLILFIPIAPSIVLSRRKYKHAQYFLAANIVIAIIIIITSLLPFNGIIPGVVMQIFIFSIGLGESIRISEKEKKIAQEQIITQLKENELLKDKVNRELEHKVKERTSEIEQQKEEITAQRDEIEAQRDEIEAQRDLVMDQKEKIEEVNIELTDSIHYAKYIQNAILPQADFRKQLLPEHFIFFKPKNIVSGDFYWLTKVEERVVVAAADCTGHGVPGAFMSMLGVSFLNDVVNKEYITHPGVILRRLRKEVIHALQQKGEYGEQQDGMDIALCSIDFKNLELQFSGANNPLYIIRNKEFESIQTTTILENGAYNLYEIKGDTMPIAIHQRMDKFKMHEIQLLKGDCLYMFSDGFADQFGGKNGKKFKYKPFKEL